MTLVYLWLALAAPPDPSLLALREGPIDFRCDHGQAYSKPRRWLCRQNVVVRRADLLLCCEEFEGYQGDDGKWQRFVCSKNVRARRAAEMMWADRATFVVETSDLILTGKPLLQRGKTILRGERIVVDTKYEQARIEQPRGHFEPASFDTTSVNQAAFQGALPARCPIPNRGAAP